MRDESVTVDVPPELSCPMTFLPGSIDRPEIATAALSLRPDYVIFLDVDPRTAWRRRKQFTLAERGLHAGASKLDQETFITYQSRVASRLRWMSEAKGWARLTVAANTSLAETEAIVVDLIETRRRQPG